MSMTFEEYAKKHGPHLTQQSIDSCKDWSDKVHACNYLGIPIPWSVTPEGMIEEQP